MSSLQYERYYDRAGNPITSEEWTKAFKDNAVKKTAVGDFDVSTIHLGLNHAFGEGPPLIFETIVFDNSPSKDCPHCGQTIYKDNPQFRYSTEADAIAHHDAVVAALKAGGDVPAWPPTQESGSNDGE